MTQENEQEERGREGAREPASEPAREGASLQPALAEAEGKRSPQTGEIETLQIEGAEPLKQRLLKK